MTGLAPLVSPTKFATFFRQLQTNAEGSVTYEAFAAALVGIEDAVGAVVEADADDNDRGLPEAGRPEDSSVCDGAIEMRSPKSSGEDYSVCDGAIETTHNLLGALIAQPPLKEKLLRRPPFRFLHDIVMSVTAATGFAAGLYTGDDETNSRAITERPDKLRFLTKIILCTAIHAETPDLVMTVRPAKIVAGLEAQSTNVFLQHLAVAAAAGRDSAPAVETVLATVLARVASIGGGDSSSPQADTAPAAEDDNVPEEASFPAAATAAAEEEAAIATGTPGGDKNQQQQRQERQERQEPQAVVVRARQLPDGWRAAASRYVPGLVEFENVHTRERVEQRPAYPASEEAHMSPDLYAHDPDTREAMVHYAQECCLSEEEEGGAAHAPDASAALFVAARSGGRAAFDAVLARADFAGAVTLDARDAYEWTGLHRAVLFGNLDVCTALLDHANFSLASAGDRGGMNALHWACLKGHGDVVDLLLASDRFAGDAVNAGDASGDTCLMIAARYGHAGVCRALLAHGRFTAAAANAREEDGCSALHHAAEKGHADVVRVLLDHEDVSHDTVNAQASDGSTALHLAADAKRADACKALLRHPRFVNVDAVEMNGATALHAACDNAMPEVCALILAHPHCRTCVNAGDAEFGVTALHVCAERGLVDVAARILVHPTFSWGLCVGAESTPALEQLMRRISNELRPEMLARVLAGNHGPAGEASAFVDVDSADGAGSGLTAAAGPRSPPPSDSTALVDAMGEMRAELQEMRETGRRQAAEIAALERGEAGKKTPGGCAIQ